MRTKTLKPALSLALTFLSAALGFAQGGGAGRPAYAPFLVVGRDTRVRLDLAPYRLDARETLLGLARSLSRAAGFSVATRRRPRGS